MGDGKAVGEKLGSADGFDDGTAEGFDDGALELEGCGLGCADGFGDGKAEGFDDATALLGEELGCADGTKIATSHNPCRINLFYVGIRYSKVKTLK